MLPILICAVFVVLALGSKVSTKSNSGLSVFFDRKTRAFEVKEGADVTANAYGYYYTNYEESGWNYLDVFMNNKIFNRDDHLIAAKAMGFLEVFFFSFLSYFFLFDCLLVS